MEKDFAYPKVDYKDGGAVHEPPRPEFLPPEIGKNPKHSLYLFEIIRHYGSAVAVGQHGVGGSVVGQEGERGMEDLPSRFFWRAVIFHEVTSG